MTQTQYRVPRDKVRWNIVDNEAVLIQIETSYYYSLNKTGTFVWEELLVRPQTADELTQRVAAHFGRDTATARADLMQFLDSMIAEQLVAIVSDEYANPNVLA